MFCCYGALFNNLINFSFICLPFINIYLNTKYEITCENYILQIIVIKFKISPYYVLYSQYEQCTQ